MLTGKRILVLEDEPLILLDIATALQEAGAEVFEASTLDESRMLLNGQILDAALLDVHLNSDHPLEGASCQEIAEKLYAQHIPFAFVTGEQDMDGWHRAFSEAPILKKPYNENEVVTICAQLFSGFKSGAGSAA